MIFSRLKALCWNKRQWWRCPECLNNSSCDLERQLHPDVSCCSQLDVPVGASHSSGEAALGFLRYSDRERVQAAPFELPRRSRPFGIKSSVRWNGDVLQSSAAFTQLYGTPAFTATPWPSTKTCLLTTRWATAISSRSPTSISTSFSSQREWTLISKWLWNHDLLFGVSASRSIKTMCLVWSGTLTGHVMIVSSGPLWHSVNLSPLKCPWTSVVFIILFWSQWMGGCHQRTSTSLPL